MSVLFSANHWVQVRTLRRAYVIPLLSSSFTNFNSSLEGDLRNIPFCDIPMPRCFRESVLFWRQNTQNFYFLTILLQVLYYLFHNARNIVLICVTSIVELCQPFKRYSKCKSWQRFAFSAVICWRVVGSLELFIIWSDSTW